MTMLDALRATVNTRKLARPATGLRPGLGYYVQGSFVWLHDPTALSADLRSLLQRRATMPPWEQAQGEWEVVDGR